MGRIGIFIGDKEIVRRYVGDKLVWVKFKVLETNLNREADKINSYLRLNITDSSGNVIIKSLTGIHRLTFKHKWSNKVWELDNDKIESYQLYTTYLVINLKDRLEDSFKGSKMTDNIYTNAIFTLEYYE